MDTKSTIRVDSTLLQLMNLYLKQNRGTDDCKFGEVIETFTADMGSGYEIDIKVVNGDETSGAYVDAILFLNGSEVSCLQPGFESLDGYFFFEDGDNRFIVVID